MDTAKACEEKYHDDYNDGAPLRAKTEIIELVLIYDLDLIICLRQPIIDVIVALGYYFTHLKCILPIKCFGDTCREEILFRGLLLHLT